MAAEDKPDGPVEVPADVLEGLVGGEAVGRAHVLVLAKHMGYRRTVLRVEEHPEEYARGISRI